MTDIHIPPAALEAGRKAFTEAMLTVPQPDPIRAAFVAMVSAWPGMVINPGDDHPKFGMRPHLFIPLMEKTDDQA